jgi:hypothetical protein
MTNDSETEIDPEALLAAIGEEERCDGSQQPSVDAFMDALTTVEGDLAAVLASDEADIRAADGVLDGLTGRQSGFRRAIETLDDRYAPYREEMTTWIEYDSSADIATKRWPFALAEDEEVSSDE